MPALKERRVCSATATCIKGPGSYGGDIVHVCQRKPRHKGRHKAGGCTWTGGRRSRWWHRKYLAPRS